MTLSGLCENRASDEHADYLSCHSKRLGIQMRHKVRAELITKTKKCKNITKLRQMSCDVEKNCHFLLYVSVGQRIKPLTILPFNSTFLGVQIG